jgi:hypothetical protein
MNFKNELQELEVYLSGKGEPGVHATDGNGNVNEQISQIKSSIRTIAFGIVKPKQRRIYIQRHQQALVGMLNRVFHLLHPDNDVQDASMQVLYVGLQELHSFLQDEYPDCFDLQAQAPHCSILSVREELQGQMDGLTALLTRTKASKKLVEAVLSPYRAILEGREEGWSYEKLRWLKSFIPYCSNCLPRPKAAASIRH